METLQRIRPKTNNYRSKAALIISVLFSLLLAYSACKSIFDLELALQEMRNQAFPLWTSHYLIWLNIVWQGVTALTLVWSFKNHKIRILGSLLNLALWIFYTTYTELAFLNVFRPRPCACIYFIDGIAWRAAFFTNSILLTLAIILHFINLKRGGSAK